MNALDNYLTAVESRTGLARDEVLAMVLHIDTMAADHLRTIAPSMSAGTAQLAARLDFEVKVANPGVHYVRRGTYLGYRREQAGGGRAGARTQVFLSVVPKKRYLNVVFVAPDTHPGTEFVEHLGELGHHGVGTARCEIHNDADLARFLEEYAEVVALPALTRHLTRES